MSHDWYGRPNSPLGCEDGYKRLPDDALIQEGDETYGAITNSWEPANAQQIGKKAGTVGGFGIWRRKSNGS